jgi:hypothetical protein
LQLLVAPPASNVALSKNTPDFPLKVLPAPKLKFAFLVISALEAPAPFPT